jgi:hypothetical protein
MRRRLQEWVKWRVAVVALAVLLGAALLAERLSNSSSGSAVGEWYQLKSPYGRCARLYRDDPLQQFELVICRRDSNPFTCWERPVGLSTLEGGVHRVELRRRDFDAACDDALRNLTAAQLRP